MFQEDGERRLKSVGFRDAVMALDGLGSVLSLAKELQIEGLNREGFSLAEYRWVRERFYRALGFSRSHVYVEDFAAALKEGEDYSMPDEEEVPASSPRDKDLAALYSDSVAAWYPFLVFGL
jgi:hypothetical protein